MKRRTLLASAGALLTGCVSAEPETQPRTEREPSPDNEGGDVDDGDADNERATVGFGTAERLPTGAHVEVSGPRTTDSLDYTLRSGRETSLNPDPGNVYAIMNVTAENVADEAVTLPNDGDFALVVGTNQYEPAFYARVTSGVYEGGRVQPGVVRDGRVIYQVPEGTDMENARIVWDGYDGTVVWTNR